MNIYEGALQWVQWGFRVFPLHPNTKIAAIKEWQIHASSDPEQIAKWFQGTHYNIGVLTKGHIAIDVDCKDLKKDGIKTMGKLQKSHGLFYGKTLMQSTPSGGYHILYKSNMPMRSGVSVLGPGIDIRAEGAYIVGWPSVLPNGEYKMECEMMPIQAEDALLALLKEKEEAKEKKSPQLSLVVATDPNTAINRGIEFLKQLPEVTQGERNHEAYKSACVLRDLGCAEDDTFLTMAEHWNCNPTLGPTELRDAVKHAFTYATGTPGSKSPEAMFGPVGETIEPAIDKTKFPFKKANEFAAHKKKNFIVEDFIDMKSMSVMYGESNTGKSFLALDMALHTALGWDWFGKKVKQGPVLYIAAEAPASIEQRTLAFFKHYTLSQEQIDAIPFWMLPGAIDLLNSSDSTKLIESVEAIMKEQKPILTVIDTLSRVLAGGNENQGDIMSKFISNVDKIKAKLGCHALIIHHCGKDKAKGARGHSSLRAATDTEIEIANSKFKVTKQRDYDSGEPGEFHLDVVNLEKDEDGKQISSCVVKNKKLNPFAKIPLKNESRSLRAFECLKDLLDIAGKPAPEQAVLPAGAKVVLTEDWKQHFVSLHYAEDDRRVKYTAFKEARDICIQCNQVGEYEEFSYLMP